MFETGRRLARASKRGLFRSPRRRLTVASACASTCSSSGRPTTSAPRIHLANDRTSKGGALVAQPLRKARPRLHGEHVSALPLAERGRLPRRPAAPEAQPNVELSLTGKISSSTHRIAPPRGPGVQAAMSFSSCSTQWRVPAHTPANPPVIIVAVSAMLLRHPVCRRTCTRRRAKVKGLPVALRRSLFVAAGCACRSGDPLAIGLVGARRSPPAHAQLPAAVRRSDPSERSPRQVGRRSFGFARSSRPDSGSLIAQYLRDAWSPRSSGTESPGALEQAPL